MVHESRVSIVCGNENFVYLQRTLVFSYNFESCLKNTLGQFLSPSKTLEYSSEYQTQDKHAGTGPSRRHIYGS